MLSLSGKVAQRADRGLVRDFYKNSVCNISFFLTSSDGYAATFPDREGTNIPSLRRSKAIKAFRDFIFIFAFVAGD